ncbi:RagB/SusD family nutrient uptake outer membrane protein [Paraflavitalea speifideaquila]|uniref:RagB/SusD family nutrient uptake outer membrane protein n=1 Tax=Paraflavitalea speifideaquila TaxID=3076558 RepID=UPI0028E1FF69|nr:RagB/SusD family nutrient uptake outer membrane protein [Paraflavitalea speifideiaquila]
MSEILLNYAEAVAELDQLGKYAISTADLDKSVNLLRTRAGIAKLEAPGGQAVAVGGTTFVDTKKDPTVTSLVWEIRRERRVELMMDGFRYQDLMRWKKGEYMDNAKNPDIFLGAKVPDNGKVLRNAAGYIMTYAATAKRTFIDPKHYLSAVPTGQISLYPAGVLKQNPGWE